MSLAFATGLYSRQHLPTLAHQAYCSAARHDVSCIRPVENSRFVYSSIRFSRIKDDYNLSDAHGRLSSVGQLLFRRSGCVVKPSRDFFIVASLATELCLQTESDCNEISQTSGKLRIFNKALGDIRADGGSLRDAGRILAAIDESGVTPDSETYTHLIAICARSRSSKAAADLLQCMRADRIPVTIMTYTAYLATCARSNDVKRARIAWTEMHNDNLAPSTRTCGAYVDCLARAGFAMEARDVLRDYPNGNTLIARTSIVSGLARMGNPEGAMQELNCMIAEGFVVNAHSYTAICHSLGKQGRSQEALDVLHCALEQHVNVDALLFESVICACGATGDVNSAFAVVRMMKKQRMELSDRGFEGLIYACCSSGNVERALILYDAAKTVRRATGRVLSAIASAILRRPVLDSKTEHIVARMHDFALARDDAAMVAAGVNPYTFKRKLRSIRRLLDSKARKNAE